MLGAFPIPIVAAAGCFVLFGILWWVLDIRMKRWLASHDEDGFDTDGIFQPEAEVGYNGRQQSSPLQAIVGVVRASMSRVHRYRALQTSGGLCVTALLAQLSMLGTFAGFFALVGAAVLFIME